jgi:isoprenylcysteine carboxyl methyltransferase (ICMT) family protein YpbQ
MFGLGNTETFFMLVLSVGFFIPFFINASLAKSRGKSVALILLLTFIFSWLVTLILAFLPKVENA